MTVKAEIASAYPCGTLHETGFLRSWLLLRLLLCRFGRLLFLPPLHRVVLLACRFVELHQSLDRFRDADLALLWDRLLPLLHPLIAGQQQRFGGGILLLAEQRPAEQRRRVERGPSVRGRMLPRGRALAQ